jgi:hypothetical protein
LSVPQGGIGSAFYFIMYAATLFTCIPDDTDIFGFADDHILLKKFSAKTDGDENTTITSLESTLNNIQKWMNETKLKMNPDKTEFIYFGSKTQLAVCTTDSLNVCGDCISRTDDLKYLGGNFDTLVTFKNHVMKKCSSAMVNFIKIKQISPYLTKEACETLVLGLVMSHLDYGNSLLCNIPKYTIKSYQRIQNMCAKLILGRSKHYDSSTQALIDLHWLPIKARIDFKILCLMHNCRHGEAPKYLKELLETRSTTRSFRNNTSLDYIIPRNTHHRYGDRSFSYYGPLIWNKLPYELKCIKDIKLFKRTCKTYLFKEYLL